MNVPFKIVSGKEFEVIYDFLKLSSLAEIQNINQETLSNMAEYNQESFINPGKHCFPLFLKKEKKTKKKKEMSIYDKYRKL